MKLIIGTITYNNSTVKYLPDFFDSLKKQTFTDFKLLVADNSEMEENENKKYMDNVADLNFDFWWNKENLGFGRAYNKIIKRAIEFGADYFLVINPDVKLTETALEKMVSVLDADSSLGSVSPKILKWDFSEIQNSIRRGGQNYELIDTCGIGLLPGLRFVDIGQAQEDKGQFENVDILGPSGACGLYRISALQQIAENGKYFDELMFMYKEDCDLVYRLHLAGLKSRYVTEAIVYHDRTASAIGESNLDIIKNRKNKSKQVRIWSFVNQQIIYWKYWRVISGREKLVVVWNQIKLLAYIILFEQYLLLHLIEMRMKCRLAKVY
ncbi:glycosyltransferase family 2 protein [Candidatus Parcubacteria bacterium]|nr:glycosyltransferase family 2 protein [Patescibacteria group bacterium]MBU4309126.1 glycosyltransferase family 2 protein [Patescibacteria group bacterium]MBU4432187.1 glycosyltransferase family 2 protein [Patescibacteria group bacterium]MBU4577487.1 glycosyltransferase family 2 protein [Patescibacteria group bacterium]MCG2697175.1 glycosyltransferase family 2 protein [Candidatus Parcubacteria bacterium]